MENKGLAWLLKAAGRVKPVLVRLLPRKWLRRAKQRLVFSASSGIATAAPAPFRRDEHPDGINLIGSVGSATGLGQSSRLVAGMVRAAGVPLAIYEYHPLSFQAKTEAVPPPETGAATPYNINLIHLNPHELALAYLQIDPATWDARYNIMFWLWELEEFPEEWLPALNLADEIWTPSDFAAIGVKKRTGKPCRTLPYAIDAPVDPACGRAHFGLPEDQFLLLCMYDSGSIRQRKNPEGVIRAFTEALGDVPDCGLVIKAGGADREELAWLKKATAHLPRVYLLTETMPKKEVNALIACADAYVSLHRAEGFGLVMAEAMLLGTPVIATDWSANTEFMNGDVACMVGYNLVEIGEDLGPFKKGNRWAEPDTGQAAGHMRRLYEDKPYRQALAARAQTHIRDALSSEKAAGRVRQRIEEIYRGTTEPRN